MLQIYKINDLKYNFAYLWLNAAWSSSKENISIAIVSPYASQVTSIQENLEGIYERHNDLKVETVDNMIVI
jgi:superfamily I DNA and/or RNA helicase